MAHRPAYTLIACLAAAFSMPLDQSALNTAVPVLGTMFSAGPAALQRIVAGYSLTFELVLVPMGRPGDAYGRKWFSPAARWMPAALALLVALGL